MGYPIHLKHSNYDRAKFQFNFCILISEEEYEMNFLVYEFLLKKIAKTFEMLEVYKKFKMQCQIESGYDFIKKNRNIILHFLKQLWDNFESKQEIISICLDTQNQLVHSSEKFHFYFKYINFSKAKEEILIYQVPVWIKCISDNDLKYFESNIKNIIENIDGLSHVKKIASNLCIDINYVVYIIYNLLNIKCITMVDIFQFTNIYRATPFLKTTINNNNNNSNKSLSEEFKNFCEMNYKLYNNQSKFDDISDTYTDTNKDKIDIDGRTLFSLYCLLTTSQTVVDFISKIKCYDISIPLFISYGIYLKIIRRVHLYGYLKKKEKDYHQGSNE